MDCCDQPGLLPISQALVAMKNEITPISDTEYVPLSRALNRVSADDIHSPMFVPPFDNSAMDGYAVRISDLHQSKTLKLIGSVYAGQTYTKGWPKGTCIRITTGAPIPQHCDAVVMQELTSLQGDSVTFNIEPETLKVGSNIRPMGDDIHLNETVITKGTRLTARDLPLLASLGIDSVKVYRKPRVAFFSTGDELVDAEHTITQGQIYDSNRYIVESLLSKMGCDAFHLGIIPDEPELLAKTFKHAASIADIVISSGGVSVGDADFTKSVLEEEGKINFWKLAMKPGKPFAFGQLNHALFCGLPGNPVSAFVTFYVLVQPLIECLSGHCHWKAPSALPAKLTSPIKKRPGRADFQRGFYEVVDGGITVTAINNQSSGAFKSLSLANCFITLDIDEQNKDIGDNVTIQPFNHLLQ